MENIHSTNEKGIIEGAMEYIESRTECFDGYFSCKMNKCSLKYVIRRLNHFADFHFMELGIQPKVHFYPTRKEKVIN